MASKYPSFERIAKKCIKKRVANTASLTEGVDVCGNDTLFLQYKWQVYDARKVLIDEATSWFFNEKACQLAGQESIAHLEAASLNSDGQAVVSIISRYQQLPCPLTLLKMCYAYMVLNTMSFLASTKCTACKFDDPRLNPHTQDGGCIQSLEELIQYGAYTDEACTMTDTAKVYELARSVYVILGFEAQMLLIESVNIPTSLTKAELYVHGIASLDDYSALFNTICTDKALY